MLVSWKQHRPRPPFQWLTGLVIFLGGLWGLMGCGSGAASQDSEEVSGIEVGNPGDEKKSTATVTGVSAVGAALSGISIRVWDAQGHLLEGGLTDVQGNYRLVLATTTSTPLLICAQQNESPLCGVLEQNLASTTTWIRHLNPVTNQAVQGIFQLSTSALMQMTPAQIGNRLRLLVPGTYETQGQQVVDRVVGSGMPFQLFARDPGFIAQSSEGNRPQSLADALLDEFGKLAQAEAQDLASYLQERVQNISNTSTLENPTFQINLLTTLYRAGHSQREVEQMLEGAIQGSSLQAMKGLAPTLDQVTQSTIAGTLSPITAQVRTAINVGINAVVRIQEQRQGQGHLSQTEMQALTSNFVTCATNALNKVAEPAPSTPQVIMQNAMRLYTIADQLGFVLGYLKATGGFSSAVQTRLTTYCETLALSLQSILTTTNFPTQGGIVLADSLNSVQTQITNTVQKTIEQIKLDPLLLSVLVNSGSLLQSSPGVLVPKALAGQWLPVTSASAETSSENKAEEVQQIQASEWGSTSRVTRWDAQTNQIEWELAALIWPNQLTIQMSGVVRGTTANGSFTWRETAAGKVTGKPAPPSKPINGHWSAKVQNNRLQGWVLNFQGRSPVKSAQLLIEVPLNANSSLSGKLLVRRAGDP